MPTGRGGGRFAPGLVAALALCGRLKGRCRSVGLPFERVDELPWPKQVIHVLNSLVNLVFIKIFPLLFTPPPHFLAPINMSHLENKPLLLFLYPIT